ncbi:MAG: hypothetical protein HZB53_01865 [Chloroflexi bacterium]|nr:hypothetical protein [Chloroflexota bacterium]
MTTKKVVALVLVTNLLCLVVLGGIMLSTPKAQASAPATASLVGPYYITFSGADFHSYSDSFAITRAAYAVVRNTSYGIGVAGLHLPSGAVLAQVANDSDVVSVGGSKTQVLVLACPIGDINCPELGRAEQTTWGRHTATGSLGNVTVDDQNKAYFVQVNLPDDSSFFYARIEYSLPAPVFLPAIMR